MSATLLTQTDELAEGLRASGASSLGMQSVRFGLDEPPVKKSIELFEQGAWVFAISSKPLVADGLLPRDAGVLGKPHAVVVSYRGDEGDVVVPDTLGGLAVREVFDRAFSGCVSVQSLRVASSVVAIGLKSFEDCPQLVSIWLSDAVEMLDDTLFFKCPNLCDVHFPDALRHFSRRIVENCALSELHLPGHLESIAWGMHDRNTLSSVEIDGDDGWYTTDGLAIFDYHGQRLAVMAVSVTSYRVPDECHSIAHGAFNYINALASIELGAGVEEIGPFAFAHTSLTRVDIGTSVRRICDHAFYMCHRLFTANFDEGVRSIGDYAFSRTAITQVRLPQSLEELSEFAFVASGPMQTETARMLFHPHNPYLYSDGLAMYFRHEDGLTLHLGISLPSCYIVAADCVAVEQGAFRRSSNLMEVIFPDGLKRIGAGACKGCARLRAVTLPDSLEVIEEEAFFETSLQSVYIGASLAAIGARAFAKVDSIAGARPHPLEHVDISPDNETFYVDEHLLIERREGGDRAVTVLSDGGSIALGIPERVSTIDDMCFFHASIDELRLHAHMSSIASGAFSRVSSIACLVIEPPERDGADIVLRVGVTGEALDGIAACIGLHEDGCAFSFEAYDTWLATCWQRELCDEAQLARMVLERLEQPYHMGDAAHERYERIMHGILHTLVEDCARTRDYTSLDLLEQHGYLNPETIDEALELVERERSAETLAYLMEMKKRKFGFDRHDFSI